MDVDRMIKYFGDLISADRIAEIADGGEVSQKVEDKYLNITIQHVPTFRRNQMRIKMADADEVERICREYEMRRVREERQMADAW